MTMPENWRAGGDGASLDDAWTRALTNALLEYDRQTTIEEARRMLNMPELEDAETEDAQAMPLPKALAYMAGCLTMAAASVPLLGLCAHATWLLFRWGWGAL